MTLTTEQDGSLTLEFNILGTVRCSQLDWPDVSTASKLCVGGPCQLSTKIKKPAREQVMSGLLAREVYPGIAASSFHDRDSGIAAIAYLEELYYYGFALKSM